MLGLQVAPRKGSWETSQEPSFFSLHPFIIFDPIGKSHSLSVKPVRHVSASNTRSRKVPL